MDRPTVRRRHSRRTVLPAAVSTVRSPRLTPMTVAYRRRRSLLRVAALAAVLALAAAVFLSMPDIVPTFFG